MLKECSYYYSELESVSSCSRSRATRKVIQGEMEGLPCFAARIVMSLAARESERIIKRFSVLCIYY